MDILFIGHDPANNLDTLRELLKTQPLDPRMAPFYYALGAPHGYGDGRAGYRLAGSFWRVSCAFAINGTVEELAELRALVADNCQSEDYKLALQVIKAQQKAAHEAYLASIRMRRAF